MSAKRKSDAIEIDSDDDRLSRVTDNCDQVRRKIRAFLNAGEMKVGEFQKALGVSSNAYMQAHIFFKKRELQGIQIPKKKAKKEEESAMSNVSAIRLEGEDTVSVPVYESCDEVRKKISAYLRKDGITQAGFLREIAKTYPDGRKIQSKVLNDFLGKRGATAGNTSSVFYAAYVFFEKLRIAENKPKSKHRLEMEDIHPGGMDTKNRHDRGYLCLAGEVPYEDKYGRVHIARKF
ncbi:hypothetical protein F5884DRAFT_785366 [Xylogone sp. PMI_703]|nr:hypothetical protein F5884DRAFT_785366 [Xylogone sp. PMI_703]